MNTKTNKKKFVPNTSAPQNSLVKAMQVQSNLTTTENGALTNKSTLSSVLDWFGAGGAIRTRDEASIIQLFSKAFAEDRLLAMKVLFYLRDVRSGQGEKRAFRICMKWLAENYPDVAKKNLENIPFFGRYDDLYSTIGSSIEKNMFDLIVSQLTSDIKNMKKGESVSLLAKWMPSENTSSKITRELGRKTRETLGLSSKNYRKTLSALRKYIEVIETKMCSGDWKSIDFEKVPSKASLNYRKAFGRHDQDRYASYLKSVEKGEAKINAGAVYPYEIMRSLILKTPTAQEILASDLMWKAMPNWLEGNDVKMMPISDVSGSMMSPNGLPILVSVSLAMYLAERNVGPFKDFWLNFSSTPTFQKFVGNNIYEKWQNMDKYNWGGSTDLQAAFDLILSTAIKNNVSQHEIPEVLVIISDMEFNCACSNNKATNFDVMRRKFQSAGYKPIQVIWWNVNSKNDNFPIKLDDTGTALVSGCSPSIFKSILGGKKFDPMSMVYDTVNVKRYDRVVV